MEHNQERILTTSFTHFVTTFRPTTSVRRALLRHLRLTRRQHFTIQTRHRHTRMFDLHPSTLDQVLNTTAILRVGRHRRHTTIFVSTRTLNRYRNPIRQFVRLQATRRQQKLRRRVPLRLVPQLGPIVRDTRQFFRWRTNLQVSGLLLRNYTWLRRHILNNNIFTRQRHNRRNFNRVRRQILRQTTIRQQPIALGTNFMRAIIHNGALYSSLRHNIRRQFRRQLTRLIPVVNTNRRSRNINMRIFTLVRQHTLHVSTMRPTAILNVVGILLRQTRRHHHTLFNHQRLTSRTQGRMRLAHTDRHSVTLQKRQLVFNIRHFVQRHRIDIPTKALPRQRSRILRVLLRQNRRNNRFELKNKTKGEGR